MLAANSLSDPFGKGGVADDVVCPSPGGKALLSSVRPLKELGGPGLVV